MRVGQSSVSILAVMIWAIIPLFLLALVSPAIRTFAMNGYKNVFYALAPSAERAYAYGNRHFDATHPAEYDIEGRNIFLEKANELNPELPYLQHQRARITS